MQTDKTTTKRKAQATADVASPLTTSSRIVKRAPPPKRDDEDMPKQMPAGEYRVIHGQICIPLDPKEYTDSTGQIIEHKPKCTYARVGDIVFLSAHDATNAAAADLIEEVDAKPSRAGKVWTPPKTTKNLNS